MTEDLLRRGLRSLGLPEAPAPAMARYAELLAERNRVMDLTAVTDEAEVVTRHFLDSAALLTVFDFTGKRVLDVGSGAGFPGLVLRLAEPSIRLTLLDARGKRVDFQRDVCAALGLDDVASVQGRAEEYGKPGGEGREAFDIVTARAVAALPVLAELCLPLTAVGGHFLAMKAADCGAEVDAARNAVKTLGGRLDRVAEYTVPGTDVVRRLVIVEKVRPAPDRYPRAYGQIKKKPLS